MQPSTSPIRKVTRNVAILAGAGVLAYFGWGYVKWLIHTDAFAAYRPTGAQSDIGMRLNNVEVRHYHANKLVTKADVNRVDIRKDRQAFQLFDIKNGKYFGSDKGPISFDASRGDWNNPLEVLHATGLVHVQNQDMDLTGHSLNFDRRRGVLDIPTPLGGRLSDGTINAANFRYRMSNGNFSAGPSRYVGTLNPLQEVAQGDAKTKWDVKAKGVRSDGKVQYYTEGSATDGDIIVSAPKIERETKTDVITATGRVYYYSAKANLVADKVVVYRKEKRAVLTGNVQMLVKSKEDEAKGVKKDNAEIAPFHPDVPAKIAQTRPTAPSYRDPDDKKIEDELRSPDTMRKYPLHIEAENIEYWYGKGNRHAKITGSPKAHQEIAPGFTRDITTHDATYDGENEILVLNSTPGTKDTHLVTSKGDDYKAITFTVSTAEGVDDYSGVEPEGSSPDPNDEDLNSLKKKPPVDKKGVKPPDKKGGGK